MFIIGIGFYWQHIFKTSSYVARHQTHCCNLQGIYFKFTNFIYSSRRCTCSFYEHVQMYVSSLSRLFLAGHFVMGSSYSAVGFQYPERSSYSWSNLICYLVRFTLSDCDVFIWLSNVAPHILQENYTINILWWLWIKSPLSLHLHASYTEWVVGCSIKSRKSSQVTNLYNTCWQLWASCLKLWLIL